MTTPKPGDWAEYKWLVPVYEGSRLDNSAFVRPIEWDLDHPQIGIYCDCKQSSPWLLGAFALLPGDEPVWSWGYGWVTGDGFWVGLIPAVTPSFVTPPNVNGGKWVGEHPAGPPGTTYLRDTGDVLRDLEERSKWTDQERLKRRTGSAESIAKMLEYQAHTWGSSHYTINLECRRCGYSASMRRELVQEMLGKLWDAGVREIPLRSFDQARHAYATRR